MDKKNPVTVRMTDDVAATFHTLATELRQKVRKSTNGDVFGIMLLLLLLEPPDIQKELLWEFTRRPNGLKSVEDWTNFARRIQAASHQRSAKQASADVDRAIGPQSKSRTRGSA